MIDDTSAAPLPELPPASPPPLFTIDLGDNGGLFAPTSHDEIRKWLDEETSVWNQISASHNGIRAAQLQSVEQALGALRDARSAVDEADPSRQPQANSKRNPLDRCRTQIEAAFKNHRLPHSSTSVRKRIHALAVQDSISASFYAWVLLPSASGQPQLQPPVEVRGWRGLVEGLIDRYNLGGEALSEALLARQRAGEELHGKLEGLFSTGTEKLDALEQHYRETGDAIASTHRDQLKAFDDSQAARDIAFETLKAEHASAMQSISAAFKAGMGLRAPVEYWKTKRSQHSTRVWIFGLLAFMGMAATAVLLICQVKSLLGTTPIGQHPELWRVATLALIGLFSVWAVRLLVRMFLSNIHLATDAEERVVMVQTYLSLIEAGQVTEKEGRELILQNLFRPASDGIVKDEGIPASFFELLTRSGKS